MKIEKGDEITLSNNKSYAVVDSFELNDKHYLYLINEEKIPIIIEYRDGVLKEIRDESEYNLVLNELIDRNKEEIDKYLRETNEN